jgi:prolyl-tRNA synthetase
MKPQLSQKTQVKSRSADLSEWYNDIVLKAQLADYAPVKGCMVIRPYGYALWESIQAYLDKLIKDRGVKNAYFPLFVPMHYLQKEKEHVEGFSPQLAVVTIGGGEKLTENLAVRPTSETIMYDMYRQWTKSWRDLPILINQWCNVVRWEKRTYLFLRTTEFLWQEGHCAHLTHEESMDQVIWALNAYEQTYSDHLAMYGIKGVKSESEKFAGAGQTFTFECLMPNGKALQACTSHDLGQNFSKSFDWSVQDKTGAKVNPWQNSWGLSTRSIGGLIMVHGDDNGLVFPPNVAPIQIVIVPLPNHDDALRLATSIFNDFKNQYRLELDTVEDETAGYKFNQWEMKGVPLRIEIGNREAAQNQVTVYQRDTGLKQIISVSDLVSTLPKLLNSIQSNLLAKHRQFTQDSTHIVDSYEDFKKIMSTTRGFISAFWCQNSQCEDQVKADTKATTRCLPLDSKLEDGKCIVCGKPATHRWLFAQSY